MRRDCLISGLVLLSLCMAMFQEAAGQATSTAQVTGQAQLQATAKEAAIAAAKGDKNTEILLHGQKQATNMLRSMLMANSQQMFAINQLQKEVAKMRKRLDRHEEEVFKCKKKLDEYESAQTQLATDAVLADTIEPPEDFLQTHLDVLKRHNTEAESQLRAFLAHASRTTGTTLQEKAKVSLLQQSHRRHRLQAQWLPNPDPHQEYDSETGSISHEGGPTEAERRQMLAQVSSGNAVDETAADQGAPSDAPNWESPEAHDDTAGGLNDSMYDMTGSEYAIIQKSENTPEKIAIRKLNEVNRLAEEQKHQWEDGDDEHPTDEETSDSD